MLSWQYLGRTSLPFGATLGYVGAILGSLWKVLGATWVNLGAGPSSMESTYICWRALLEHAFVDFAYKTNGFFNDFEMALFTGH